MSPLSTIKDLARESVLLRSRIVISFVVVVGLSLALVVRLIQLQVIDYEHFRTLSNNNRVKIVPVPPTRGLIFDRNGVVLAQNTPTFTLEVVPEAVQSMDSLLADLRELIEIRDVDEERFRQLLAKKRSFETVPLRSRLTEEEVARFAVNRHRFPGVDIQARLSRDYPHGALGVHAVGYVGRIDERELKSIDRTDYRGTDHIGKTGVERSYEDLLHGTVGYEHVETNAQGRALRVLGRVPPKPGHNLYLTVDASLQAAAEAALEGRSGSVIAIEPATGHVLAMASVPGFDPNDFVDGIDTESYQALLHSPDRPLFNRALHGRYPPGSTIKPFVALAGLEREVAFAGKETFCPGFFRLKGKKHKYRDWKKGGHGHIDLPQAIVQSCDVYFYELALSIGIDRLHDFLALFGFGQRTGIDLEGEASGLNPSSEWKRRALNQPWYPGETLIAGIGQGFHLATPLQLASAAATLGARGQRMAPRIVERIQDGQTGADSLVPPEPVEMIEKRHAEHWQTVIASMEGVVHGRRGTARRVGAGALYRMAGKTGTAQVIGVGQNEEYDEEKVEERYRDHALFIAFAPVDEPRIAVAVLVENGGSGSRAAAPVARRVIDHYLVGPPGREEGEEGDDGDEQDRDDLLLTRFRR